jgi:2-dehydropantoate 2-reductase
MNSRKLGPIAVMGAGAVGCYYGGMLARAGHEVTMIGRAQHVEAMRRAGLRLQTKEFDEHLEVKAATSADGVRGAKLVLVCVKSPDSGRAGEELAPHLEADAAVLSLQNGVDNPERLAAAMKREVIGAAVYVASEMGGPGHVIHHGRGDLVIGKAASDPQASTKIAAAFSAAGIPVTISDNVMGVLWMKLIVNCSYNALSAITQLPYGVLVQGEGIWDVMHKVVDECVAVARAGGVELPGDAHAMVRSIAATIPAQYSSTAQDLKMRKPTEIDYLNGIVVRKGAQHGVPTPVNATLTTLVKVLETTGRRSAGT